MERVKKAPALAYMIICYIFTILTITVSSIYTVNGFHLIDKHMEWALFNNTINVFALIMCWAGVFIFLCAAILSTYVWTKEKNNWRFRQ